MTVPTETEPFPPEQTEEPPPPFDNGASFDITKPINLTQLTDEIEAALSATVLLALGFGPEANGNLPPSPDNHATLSVSPGNLSRSKIQKVIDDHNPTDDYDLPEAERAFAAVTQKVILDEGAELTSDEMQAAVRGLLRRAALTPPPDSHRNQTI